MNAKAKALSEEARKLTPEERIELVEDILGSLHPTDPEIENHLHNQSSFTTKYLEGKGHKLRRGCGFRYLVIENARRRALLEKYATGYLCPAHIGLGESIKGSQGAGAQKAPTRTHNS